MRLLLVGTLILLLGTCGQQRNEPRIESEEEPAPLRILEKDDSNQYVLHRISSIGSDSDTLYLFGNISEIEVYKDFVYVMDLLLQNLSIYDINTGEYIDRYHIRKGEGPGEINGPIFFTLDRDGYIYISSNRDYRIHVFDNDFLFLHRVQRPGIVRFNAINDNIHVARSYYYRTDKPLVEIIDREGELIDTYGQQHMDFEINYVTNRLSGTNNNYIAADESYSYIVHALPFEIHAYSLEDYHQEAKYKFIPEYAGGKFEGESGVLTYPTGIVVGVDSYRDHILIVYSIKMRARRDWSHYLNFVDLRNGTFSELDLTGYELGEFELYTRSAVSGDMLYINTLDPFPCVKIIKIESNRY